MAPHGDVAPSPARLRLCRAPSPRCLCARAAAHPANRTQVYLSRTADPLVNLSVEHHLVQTTPPDATVLLLYVNGPAVVFGRNQNPWLEADRARLAAHPSPVHLVRRRSGGGTVFHDEGNVNFGVICPRASFDRDRYAHMVVRALGALGRPSTRVNARHDIVVDVPDAGTFKVSGSAYKLTRLRSLHHGTCLLRSPNLDAISGLLRSPAEPFVNALGVDSVRSPVRNLELDAAAFELAVVDEFRRMHGRVHLQADFDEGALAVDKIRKGYEELQSLKWVYGQTPRFTFCTHSSPEDPRPRPRLPFSVRAPVLPSPCLDCQVMKEWDYSSHINH